MSDVLRCSEFLDRYIEGVPYEECLIPTDPEYLVKVKSTYYYNLAQAKLIASETVDYVKAVKQAYMDSHPLELDNEIDGIMSDMLVRAIRLSLQEEL